MESHAVFQAKNQAKNFTIELGPCLKALGSTKEFGGVCRSAAVSGIRIGFRVPSESSSESIWSAAGVGFELE